jgi:hypothetical protein
MSMGLKFKALGGVVVLCGGVLCSGGAIPMSAETTQTHRHAKKPAPLPPLPSGPTGPVQQVPLDSLSPVPPQVTYQNEQLTIVAPNSTLGDILRAVRKQTGADIDVPSAPERVVTHLGPGPARDVLAELLNGSRFNYILLGSPTSDAALTRVVLVVKTGPENVSAPDGPSLAEQQRLGIVPTTGNPGATPPDQDAPDAEAADDNATDDAADQAAAEAEQPASPDQPGVKTPQQMLQEMQQRQLMLQQQQPPGQPPIPGAGLPPQPPQQQQ